jgi:hypothetical protein
MGWPGARHVRRGVLLRHGGRSHRLHAQRRQRRRHKPAPQAPPNDRPELLYTWSFPVAVWALWKLAAHPERLGTSNWQSYALFGIGEEFDSVGAVRGF